MMHSCEGRQARDAGRREPGHRAKVRAWQNLDCIALGYRLKWKERHGLMLEGVTNNMLCDKKVLCRPPEKKRQYSKQTVHLLGIILCVAIDAVWSRSVGSVCGSGILVGYKTP